MIDRSEEFLTAREVARHLRIGLRTVWRWAETGTLPAPLRWGTRIVRWRAVDIADLIAHPRETPHQHALASESGR